MNCILRGEIYFAKVRDGTHSHKAEHLSEIFFDFFPTWIFELSASVFKGSGGNASDTLQLLLPALLEVSSYMKKPPNNQVLDNLFAVQLILRG